MQLLLWFAIIVGLVALAFGKEVARVLLRAVFVFGITEIGVGASWVAYDLGQEWREQRAEPKQQK
jgi:hypothetical protein